ncbi:MULTISPECIES: DUF2726 domain-containing protein [Peribacillus]|uniref:DUF2726 domain-containing protein n=1 Tax=Peribacillus TaxID=2675229 RepID=UPI001F4EDD1E|nr:MULTISPECIES: DUF2726 domain-containing protein [unclassified Peribacillus]MCK1983707.1 DUF2726 domain-containing protein [Peribacillus sp. Aquil_B1]MCK2011398.1 DUF2726 domain-containing protein [Peribacillus sp. Aquil_B8]
MLQPFEFELDSGRKEYIETKDSRGFKNKIETIIAGMASLEKESIVTQDAFAPYMELAEKLVYFCLDLQDLLLAKSVYQRLFPGFTSSFIQEQDMEKKEKMWDYHSGLIMNYFTILHNLEGLTPESIPSLGIMVRWFRSFSGYFYTDKPFIIEMLVDTHGLWREEITPEEEEIFWVRLAGWMVQDFLNAKPDDLSLYQKIKRFYSDYKKTKRLEPLAYRVLEIITLMVGVAEEKLDYSKLIEKVASLLHHMKQDFCDRQGERLSELFQEILMLWPSSGSYQDLVLLKKLFHEIHSTVYKEKVFGELHTGLNIYYLYKNKAYSFVAFIYEKGLLDEKEVEDDLFKIAYCLADAEKFETAKQLYEKLIQKDPESPSALNNVAVIYRDIAKEYDKALEYFELAAKYDPENELYHRNIQNTMETIKKEKEKPKRQKDHYFKKTDKQQKSICFTLYKLEELETVTTEVIENHTSYKGNYLKKHLTTLESLELIHHDPAKGWRLEPTIRELVESYVDPKLERQIIRNSQAVMYRPIFYHEAEITLYRVLMELFPQHFVFPNMDLKTIIQVDKIRNYIDHEHLNYLFMAHVDFAIIDTTTYFPILTFERDSEYQDVEPQKTNALKKNLIFQTSGLPLIRIRYNSAMDYERLKEEIKQATKEYILQINGNNDAESRRILASIDPKRFGVHEDLPSDDELSEVWGNLVGPAIAAHTQSLELDVEQYVLRVTVEETARPILELGAEGIKNKFYQQYPVLNSIQFYWV